MSWFHERFKYVFTYSFFLFISFVSWFLITWIRINCRWLNGSMSLKFVLALKMCVSTVLIQLFATLTMDSVISPWPFLYILLCLCLYLWNCSFLFLLRGSRTSVSRKIFTCRKSFFSITLLLTLLLVEEFVQEFTSFTTPSNSTWTCLVIKK